MKKTLTETLGKLTVLASLLGATFATPAHAEELESYTTTVEGVRSTGTRLIIYVARNGCAGGGDIYYVDNAAAIEGIRQLATTALLTGRKVRARYIKCGNSPWDSSGSIADLTLL